MSLAWTPFNILAMLVSVLSATRTRAKHLIRTSSPLLSIYMETAILRIK